MTFHGEDSSSFASVSQMTMTPGCPVSVGGAIQWIPYQTRVALPTHHETRGSTLVGATSRSRIDQDRGRKPAPTIRKWHTIQLWLDLGGEKATMHRDRMRA